MAVEQIKFNNFDYQAQKAQNPVKTSQTTETIFGSSLNSTDSIKSVDYDNDVYQSSASANTQAQELKNQLSSIKEEQGLIGKAWDGIKNLFGFGAGSNKAEDAIKQFENGEISYEEAQEAITKYQDGQDMSVDVVGDIVSGIVAVGAVAFAPFTGGASLLVGAAAGAVTKVAVKGADSLVGGRDYNMKDFGYDIITGSINGLMAPITNAIGGVAGTGVAKACGLNVAKTATKEAAEGAVTTGVKGFLTKLLANQGAEYVAKEGAETGIKTLLAKVAAYGTDMAIDGALGGATDGFARSLAEGDFENMGKNVADGFVGGLIAAPVIGGGFKVAGKAGSKLASKVFSSSATDAAAQNMADVPSGMVSGTKLAGSAAGQAAENAADAASHNMVDVPSGMVSGTKLAGSAAGQAAENVTDAAAQNMADVPSGMVSDPVVNPKGDSAGGLGIKDNPFDTPDVDIDAKSGISGAADTAENAQDALFTQSDLHAQDLKNKSTGDLFDDAGLDMTKNGHDSIPDIIVTPEEAAISKKILELSSSHSTDIKTFDVGGKKSGFTIFMGSQAGSNKGGYVVNNATGELFYSKLGSASQSQTEVLASKLYKAAGIDVPELTLYTDANGNVGLLSKYIPNLTPVSTPKQGLAKGFGMDALLANWDAVCSNNAVTNGADIYRIDVGGTFDFRAQGGKKAYTSIVDEVTTLIDPKYNQVSSNLFSSMTRSDLIDSLQRVADLSDNDIVQILQEQGMTKYQDVLLKRKQFLVDLLAEVKKMPDDGSDMLTLLTKAKTKTYETSISRATSIKDLADIQTSINKVADVNQKKVLQQLLDAKKAEINTKTLVPSIQSRVDEQTLKSLLGQCGVVKDGYGTYSMKLTQEYKDAIVDKYGASTGSQIISRIQDTLDSSDLDKMLKLINVADGKYAQYFANDMTEFVAFYQVIKKGYVFSNFDKFSPAQWDAIINTTKYKVPVSTLEALSSYKGSSSSINSALTTMKNHPSYTPPSSVKSQIDAITQYIDTQSITDGIKVYRGEGFEVLGSVEINGKKLSKLMEDALYYGDQKQIDDLIYMIEQGNYIAHQERFMSTSLLKKSAFNNNMVVWELDVPAGSKGVFLEGCNITGQLSNECEYLLQRGCKILIKHAELKNGKWHLQGSIVNQ